MARALGSFTEELGALVEAPIGEVLGAAHVRRRHPAFALTLPNLPKARFDQLWGRRRVVGLQDSLALAERRLAAWRFTPNGTEGYAKAEVTVGGIATAGLSSRTMEAAKAPGLYAIGEAVDVTGWLGGYNFQWAWSSGWAAGQVC